MEKGHFIAVAFIALFMFGCTGNGGERIVYDCTKCNSTITPQPQNTEFALLLPTGCTDELCGISRTKGWASELGFETKLYNASWAQGPILMLFTKTDAFVFQSTPTTRLQFMDGTCNFINDKKACDIYKQELENSKTGIGACLAKNGLSMGTIAFYHSETCPHCAKMKPWIQELEAQGYKFYWVEGSNSTAMTVARDCYSTILKFNDGVPQFACPSNGKWQLGEFLSKDEMTKFASDCLAAANSTKG